MDLTTSFCVLVSMHMNDIDQLDDLPVKDKHLKTWDRKDQNYHNQFKLFYNHSKRWLESKIGVEDVQLVSDWCFESKGKKSWIPIKYQNLKGLKELVEFNTFLNDDGKVYYHGNRVGYGHTLEHSVEDCYHECFYIDPTTRLLSLYKKKKFKYKPNKNPNLIKLDDDSQLIKIDGIWYWFSKNQLKNFKYSHHVDADRSYDFTVKSVNHYVSSFNRLAFAVYKKQLTSKELKQYNLKND